MGTCDGNQCRDNLDPSITCTSQFCANSAQDTPCEPDVCDCACLDVPNGFYIDCVPTVGACCEPTGCTVTTAAACAGEYQGDGSTCPDACLGACCIFDGECDLVLQVDCIDDAPITFSGVGTVCTPNTCATCTSRVCPLSQPNDPTLFYDCGESNPVADFGECLAGQCVFTTTSSSCSSNFCNGLSDGAQCGFDQCDCACMNDLDGQWRDCNPPPTPAPTPVPGAGACCLADGRCIISTSVPCTDLSGNFLGSGTLCLPNVCSTCTVDRTCPITATIDRQCGELTNAAEQLGRCDGAGECVAEPPLQGQCRSEACLNPANINQFCSFDDCNCACASFGNGFVDCAPTEPSCGTCSVDETQGCNSITVAGTCVAEKFCQASTPTVDYGQIDIGCTTQNIGASCSFEQCDCAVNTGLPCYGEECGRCQANTNRVTFPQGPAFGNSQCLRPEEFPVAMPGKCENTDGLGFLDCAYLSVRSGPGFVLCQQSSVA